MSEDSVKITGVVQVAKFMIFGLIYIAILYYFAKSMDTGPIVQNPTLNYLTAAFRGNLASHGDKAKYVLIGTIIFMGIISGMLINDLTRKLSIVTIILLLVATVVNLVPIKIIIEGI
jgi:hypothetical protein